MSRLPGLLEEGIASISSTSLIRHLVATVTTRSTTGSLPAAVPRTGVDPDLVLHPHAYDVDAALVESRDDMDNDNEDVPMDEEEDQQNGSPDDEMECKYESSREVDSSMLPLIDSLNPQSSLFHSEQRLDPLLLAKIKYLEDGSLHQILLMLKDSKPLSVGIILETHY